MQSIHRLILASRAEWGGMVSHWVFWGTTEKSATPSDEILTVKPLFVLLWDTDHSGHRLSYGSSHIKERIRLVHNGDPRFRLLVRIALAVGGGVYRH